VRPAHWRIGCRLTPPSARTAPICGRLMRAPHNGRDFHTQCSGRLHSALRRVRGIPQVPEQRRQVLGRVQHPQNSRRVGRRIVDQQQPPTRDRPEPVGLRKQVRTASAKQRTLRKALARQREPWPGAPRPPRPPRPGRAPSRPFRRDPRPPVAKNSGSGSRGGVGSPHDRRPNPLGYLIAVQVAAPVGFFPRGQNRCQKLGTSLLLAL
jgi:hypothetical protein